ncbi:hypothetical protein ACTXOW_06960 [Corynebacterium variabile]|uniref:hypothetical protein n=1 Tax=Corynebacterium variabile TaxID=1727 RepID=UPI003FD6B56C
MTYKSAVLNRYPAKVEDFHKERDIALMLATLVEFGDDGTGMLGGIIPQWMTDEGDMDWSERSFPLLDQAEYEESLEYLDRQKKTSDLNAIR